MASSSHAALFNHPVSLALLKLSFCTTVTLHAKLPWKHFSDGVDMFAVFDFVRKPDLGRSVSEKQVLKLVRQGDLLVRRIQMNFRPESGFDTAVRILRALGLPINDKSVPAQASQGRRTSSSSSQILPRYATIAEETQLKNEYTRGSNASYRAGLPDLGFIPAFNKPYPSSGGYHNGSPNEPGAYFDSLESPSRSPSLAASAGLFPSSHLSDRAMTSYGYPASSLDPPAKAADRPSTAPLTLTQLMPPRRELPFPEELNNRTKKQRIGTEGEVVDEANMGQRAAAVKSKGRAKSKPKAKEARPLSSKAKPRPTSAQNAHKEQPSSSKQAAVPRPRETRTLRSSLGQATDSPPPEQSGTKQLMVDASPAKMNTRQKSTAAALAEKSSDEPRPKNPSLLSKDLENISPEDYMSRLDHWVRKYQDFPASVPKAAAALPSSTEKGQLAAFAAQPEEDRLKVLDDMICEYLEDENFVKLVEDVQMTWRRIGLGF
ncbi:MAG: hypothetical protein Q9212_006849 [Teloschistes hypoglaucus]